MRVLGLFVSSCLGSIMLYTKSQVEEASFLGYNTSQWLIADDFQEPEFPMLQGASDSFVKDWFNPYGFTESHLRIPYRFKADNYSPDHKLKIKNALNDLSLELDHCIEFFDDTETKLYETNFIQIRTFYDDGTRATPSCSSFVGFVAGGTYQTLQLDFLGCLSASTIQHEMIHALGFQHEHERPDREKYIEVLYENIDERWHYAFDKMPEKRFESFGQPYDFTSIMHYGGDYYLSEKAKAAGEQSTIVHKGTNVQVKAQRTKPSSIDIFEIKARYSKYCTKPIETSTCNDDVDKNLYFLSRRKCDGFPDCFNGADEAYDICAKSEITPEYVTKKPSVGKFYQYEPVYDNAHHFQYFDFDTTDMINGPYFLSLSTSSRKNEEKWEFELPNKNYLERAALRKVNFEDTDKNLVQVDKYERIPEKLRLVVADGLLEMTADGQKFIKYEDSSIKKADLKYLMVSGSKPKYTNVSGSWEIKAPAGTWNIKGALTATTPSPEISTTTELYF